MLRPTTLAVILAGGRVDDLNALTYYRPKSAVPFGGCGRVIDFALSNLMNSGIEQVAILSQYRSYSLISHVGIGAAWDMIGRHRGISILPPVQDCDAKGWYRGSADAVFRNLDFIRHHAPEQVLILSGDHVYKMNYQNLITYHQAKKADVTIAFTKVPHAMAHRFGVAHLDDEDGEQGGKVLEYWEKPQMPTTDWASLTVMCFQPDVLESFLAENQKDGSFEFGRDIIPKMIGAGKRVYGYKFRDYWGYTRTVAEYWQSSMDMLGPNPPIDLEKWGVRTNLDERGVRDFQPLVARNGSKIENSMVYNGSIIEGTVRHSILFPGVHVHQGAVVENSVIFYNAEIGENACLNKVVCDVNCCFGDGSRIGGELGTMPERVTVLGWDNTVPPGGQVCEGAVIYPEIAAEHWPKIVGEGEVLQ